MQPAMDDEALQELAGYKKAFHTLISILVEEVHGMDSDQNMYGKTSNAALLCRVYNDCDRIMETLVPNIDNTFKYENRKSWRTAYAALSEELDYDMHAIGMRKHIATGPDIPYSTKDKSTEIFTFTSEKAINATTTLKEAEIQTDPIEPEVILQQVPIASPSLPKRHLPPGRDEIGFGRIGFFNTRKRWERIRQAVRNLELIPPVLPIVRRRMEQILLDKHPVHLALLFSKFDSGGKESLSLNDLRRLMGAMGVLLSSIKVRKLRREISDLYGDAAKPEQPMSWHEFHKLMLAVMKEAQEKLGVRRKSVHYTNEQVVNEYQRIRAEEEARRQKEILEALERKKSVRQSVAGVNDDFGRDSRVSVPPNRGSLGGFEDEEMGARISTNMGQSQRGGGVRGALAASDDDDSVLSGSLGGGNEVVVPASKVGGGGMMRLPHPAGLRR